MEDTLFDERGVKFLAYAYPERSQSEATVPHCDCALSVQEYLHPSQVSFIVDSYKGR